MAFAVPYSTKPCALTACKGHVPKFTGSGKPMSPFQYARKHYCSSKCAGLAVAERNKAEALTQPLEDKTLQGQVNKLVRAVGSLRTEVKLLKKTVNVKGFARTRREINQLASTNLVAIMRETLITEVVPLSRKNNKDLTWAIMHKVLEMYDETHEWWLERQNWTGKAWYKFILEQVEKDICEELTESPCSAPLVEILKSSTGRAVRQSPPSPSPRMNRGKINSLEI